MMANHNDLSGNSSIVKHFVQCQHDNQVEVDHKYTLPNGSFHLCQTPRFSTIKFQAFITHFKKKPKIFPNKNLLHCSHLTNIAIV